MSCEFTNTDVRGTIEIAKDTSPDVDQDFEFTENIPTGIGSFTLNDDGTAPPDNTNTATFAEVAPGTYRVSEAPVAGWVLSGIDCATAGGSTFAYQPSGNTEESASGDTGVDITLAPDDDVLCTFTNTKVGSITFVKVSDPADGTDFAFVPTANLSPDLTVDLFVLDDETVQPNDIVFNSKTFTGLLPDSYAAAEVPMPAWDVTDIECSVENANDGTPSYDETSATIELAAGEDWTCTFTNTKDANIVVDKVTDPVGDDAEFDFDASWLGTNPILGESDVKLTDAATPFDSGDLDPGIYTVAELDETGWDLTGATCVSSIGDDPEDPDSISLQAGETVTCTFTNTKDANIVVDKVTNPSNLTTEFDFDASWLGTNPVLGESDVQLTDAATPFDSGDLDPGIYTVAELDETGWDLTGATCASSIGDDPEDPDSISLQAGETVTCTFTNTERGTITVAKQTLPDGDPATFNFTGASTATLSDGQSSTVDVAPGEHFVTEDLIAAVGWDLTGIDCDDADSGGDIGTGTTTFNVDPGEDVTCTFTNTKDANIVVDKVTDPVGDDAEFDFDASWLGTNPILGESDVKLTDAATPFDSGDLDPGIYTVAELDETGWDLTGATCVSSIGDDPEDPDSISLQAGETVTCTFTNTKDANIVVDKVTNPSNLTTEFDFDASWLGTNPVLGESDVQLTDAATPFDSGDLDPGIYTVAELDETGWDLTGATCASSIGDDPEDPDSISLQAGETVTCTFTNTEQTSINIIEDTDPDGPQDFGFTTVGLSNFTLDDDADPALSNIQTFLSVGTGTYNVAQTPVVGWDLTSIVCTGTATFTYQPSGLVSFQTSDTGVDIGFVVGDSASCEFTNVEQAQITVVKEQSPETGQNFGFDASWLTIDPPAGDADFVLDVDNDGLFSDSRTFPGLAPGAYTVREVAEGGWDLTGLDCVTTNGDSSFIYTDDTAAITLAPGDAVTCTFSSDNQGTIEIVEDTVPDNDEVFTFTDDIVGPNFTLFDDGILANRTKVFSDVAPGTYNITEVPVTGLVLTNIECDSTGGSTFAYQPSGNTTSFQPADTGVDITLAGGDDTVSCTFTNRDDRGSIEIIKNSEPDNAQAFGFDEDITAFPALTAFDLVDDGDSSNSTAFADVVPTSELPGPYNVTETPKDGWVLTGIECSSTGGSTFAYQPSGNATASQADDVGVDITLAVADDSVSCTFTNTRDGSITFEKTSDPDDGTDYEFVPGDDFGAEPSFLLDDEPTQTDTVEGSKTFGGLQPGTYSVGEVTGVDSGVNVGFESGDLSAWTPTLPVDVSVASSFGTFTAPYGSQFAVLTSGCPGAGTTLTRDFTLTAGQVISGQVAFDSGEPFIVNDFGRLRIVQGDVVLFYMDVETIGGDGQTPWTDWSFIAPVDGTYTLEASSENWGDCALDSFLLLDLAEMEALPFDVTGISCAVTNENGGEATYGGDATFDLGNDTDATVELAAGEDWTCTFANTKDANIVIDKVTDPVGDPAVFDFDASWLGDNLVPESDIKLADADPPQDSGDLDPGTYSVTELAETGWDLTDTECVSSIGDTETADSIELDAGETVTCTFTNTKDGSITFEKVSDPADGTNFVFDPSENLSVEDFFLDDEASQTDGVEQSRTFSGLQPGTYSAAEVVPDGWDLTELECVATNANPTPGVAMYGDDDTFDLGEESDATVTIAAGEDWTCTFTNTKDANIVVNKVTDPTDDTTSVFDFDASWLGDNDIPETDFTLTNGASSDSGDLDPGDYDVAELDTAGWDLTKTTCVSSIGDTETADDIELDAGETVTCTFTNTKDAFIVIDKVTDPAGDTTLFGFDASWDTGDSPDIELTDADVPVSSGDLDPGTYSVAELSQTGWDLTNTTCVSSIGDTETAASIELDAGETVTCTFTNTKRGTINIVKNAVGGDDNFTFSEDITQTGTFTIDTEASQTDTLTFDNVLPGTYVVSETNLQEEWELTQLACSADGDSTFSLTGSNGDTPDFELGDDTATINLVPGDTVTCIYTNTDRRGSIEIVKDAGDSDGSFSFTENIIDGEGFGLVTDDGTATTEELQNSDDFLDLDPGTYTVTETVPDGWELTNIACTSSRKVSSFVYSGATESPTTKFEPGDHTVRITLGVGDDDVGCTFTNNDLRGEITITKDTSPDNGRAFEFTENIVNDDPFTLYDDGEGEGGNTETFDDVLPEATYSVTETPVIGWELTGIACTSSGGSTFAYTGGNADPAFQPGDTTAEITLAAEDTDVNCEFTNQDRRGTIIIVKDAVPNSAQDFAFTENITPSQEGPTAFTLDDDLGVIGADATYSNTRTFLSVLPGTYTVTEALVADWTLTGLNCDDANSTGNTGTRTASIVLAPNEVVTCTFTNSASQHQG